MVIELAVLLGEEVDLKTADAVERAVLVFHAVD